MVQLLVLSNAILLLALVVVKRLCSSFILFTDNVIFFHPVSPDSRVIRLIERMGKQAPPKQKRVLCMNKVDLVTKKKDMLKVAEQFKHLPGYER